MEIFDDVSEPPALITLEQTILTFGRRGSSSRFARSAKI